MAAPGNMVSSMLNDPMGQAQGTLNKMAQETEDERKKRLAQMQGQKAAGGAVAGPITSMFNSAGNQY